MNINVIKLDETVKLPSYATEGSACFDIFANETKVLANGESVTVKTGLKFEVPKDHVLMVFSRSGHGFKEGIRLGNCTGIIDSDYRGELMVSLKSDRIVAPHTVRLFNKYDSIAQGMILPIEKVTFNVVDKLTTTDRGEGGFGSTGS